MTVPQWQNHQTQGGLLSSAVHLWFSSWWIGKYYCVNLLSNLSSHHEWTHWGRECIPMTAILKCECKERAATWAETRSQSLLTVNWWLFHKRGKQKKNELTVAVKAPAPVRIKWGDDDDASVWVYLKSLGVRPHYCNEQYKWNVVIWISGGNMGYDSNKHGSAVFGWISARF